MEKSLNMPIWCVQTDWGGEFHPFSIFLFTKRNSISSSKSSCPSTKWSSQKETSSHCWTRANSISSSLHTLPFWWEVFRTVVFLINHLSSPVLSNTSPFQKLFGHLLDYSFLRNFGWLCYPHLRPYNTHKL